MLKIKFNQNSDTQKGLNAYNVCDYDQIILTELINIPKTYYKPKGHRNIGKSYMKSEQPLDFLHGK
jgi:hypothetical protein